MPLLEQRIGKIFNIAIEAARTGNIELLSNVTLEEATRTLAIFGNRIDKKAPAYAMLEKYLERLNATPPEPEAAA